MENESTAIVLRLIDAFERLSRAEWRKKLMLGIKGSEVRVLLCIDSLSHEDNTLITVSEISKRLMITSPSVTEFVKSLSIGGYVERCVDSKDKRVIDIMLTDRGQKLVQNIKNHLNLLFSDMLERLGQEKSHMLVELLDEVILYLHEADIKTD